MRYHILSEEPGQGYKGIGFAYYSDVGMTDPLIEGRWKGGCHGVGKWNRAIYVPV